MADNDLIIISNVLMINNELNNGQYAIALTEDKIKTLRMIVNAKKVSIRVYAKSAKNGYLMSTDQPKKHCDTRQSRQSVL